MDSFTQKLLERTQARREVLNAKIAQIPHPVPRKRRSPLKEETNGGRLSTTGNNVLLDQEKNDDDSPEKRHCLHEKRQETKENDNSSYISDFEEETLATIQTSNEASANAIDCSVKSKPIAESDDPPIVQKRQVLTPNPRGRSSRLAALAAHINNWEDDSQSRPPTSQSRQTRPPLESNSTPPQSSCEGSSLSSSSVTRTPSSSSEPVPRPPPLPVLGSPIQTPKFNLLKSNALVTKEVSNDQQRNKNIKTSSLKSSGSVSKAKDQTPKKVVWDRAIVATLEAQGFVQSPSKSKLEYNFKGKNGKMTAGKKGSSVSDSDTGSDEKSPSPKRSSQPSDDFKKRSVKDLARKFDTPSAISTSASQKDPAEMPLSARVAMFEKSSCASLPVPKKPVFATSSNAQSVAKPRSKSSTTPPPKEETNSDLASLSPTKVGRHTFEIHRRLFENVDKNWKSNEIAAKVKEDRQKDMDVVLNRWTYGKKVLEPKSSSNNGEKAEYRVLSSTTSSSSCYKESGSSEDDGSSDEDASEEDDCAEVTNNRGHIPIPPPMPTTSPAKPPEEEDDDDDENDDCESQDSYDRLSDPEVQRRALENVQNVFSEIDNLSTESEVDDNDALQVASERITNTTDFNSSILKAAFQEIESCGTKESLSCDTRQNVAQPMPEASKYVRPPSVSYDYNLEAKEELPLMHTVSFYRRQKEVNKTPIKVIIRKEEVPSPTSPRSPLYGMFSSTSSDEFRAFVQDKIKELQEDANAQLIVMSQASQALNLCRSTAEFHGSTEQIEGERLLLISSQRRQACLNEIQRLKTEGALGGVMPNGAVMNKGSLTLGEMKLSLKREFLAQTDSGKSGEFVHYFVCLVKHRGQVIATQMVSTLDGISAGAFHLPNLINVRDLDHDFNVLFEVYGLQTNRENLSKSRKTLANRKEKSKLTLTPKKRASKQDSRLTSPAIQSPGGPSAICTSSFSMIGFTMINIKSLQRKQWTLEKVPFVSPLEGNLLMKVQCHTDSHIDEQGFLTMFEDVSGFGAWHRRWFHLTRRYLSYWKYPDDVKRKEPIGRIDLCECVTSEVSLVPRDICARPHTLMLLVVRPPSEDDTNTLVSQSYNTYTSTKVLLSADTKEERILWCQHFNEALKCLRMWDPHALRPIPSD